MTDKARVTEIAPDHHVISVYVPQFNLRFNHFLINDEEPLLFHTGMKHMFPQAEPILHGLADLRPERLALMHGSTFLGDGEGALRNLATVIREVLGQQEPMPV